MPGPLIVFARFLAKAGEEAALRAELMQMIAPTRDETDNLFYDLHQAPEQPAMFVLHEGWRNAEALRRHMQTPHFRAMERAVQPLQAEPYSVVQTHMISAPGAAADPAFPEEDQTTPRRPPFPPAELVSPHGAS